MLNVRAPQKEKQYSDFLSFKNNKILGKFGHFLFIAIWQHKLPLLENDGTTHILNYHVS
jgi:hypothetical protein